MSSPHAPADSSSTCLQPDCKRTRYEQGRCILHALTESKDLDRVNEAIAEEIDGQDRIRFVKAHFPKGSKLVFNGVWHDSLTIRDCHFYGAANFSSNVFPTGTSFAGTTFHDDAVFERSTFLCNEIGHPSFRRAKFCKRANFKRCTFKAGDEFGDCDFSGAVFSGGLMLTYSKIRDARFSNASFGDTIGLKNILFQHLYFYDTKDIYGNGAGAYLLVYPSSKAKEGKITASNSAFRGVEIGGMEDGHLDLTGACIENNLFVWDCSFRHGVRLRDVTVGGNVEIKSNSLDHCDLDLQGFDCSGSLDIVKCTFSDPLKIQNLKNDPQQFSLTGCAFEGGLHLEGDRPSKRLFSTASKINLDDLTFSPNCPVSIRNVDLSNARLLDTDVRDIEFTGVTWDTKSGPYRIERRAVHDEACEEKTDDPDYRKLERLYRELKQSFESRKNWYSAGHFHIGEKEMQRKGTDSSARRAMLTIYRFISLYGERAFPAFVALALTLLGFAALYIGVGLQPAGPDGYLQFWGGSWKMFRWSWGSSLNFAVQHIGIGRASGYELAAGAQFLTVIQRVLCTTLVALAALAIRQQMKR